MKNAEALELYYDELEYIRLDQDIIEWMAECEVPDDEDE